MGGQTLNRETYLYSQAAFPDLMFTLEKLSLKTISSPSFGGQKEPNQGDLIGLAMTGKRVSFYGNLFME